MDNAMDEKTYLTAKEAADFLGITKKYLYQLTHKHAIPYYSPMGRHILFKRHELVAMIERSRVSTQDELIKKVHSSSSSVPNRF